MCDIYIFEDTVEDVLMGLIPVPLYSMSTDAANSMTGKYIRRHPAGRNIAKNS